MTPSSWLGHWQTWTLIGVTWLGLGLVFGLLVGVICRVGNWRERKKP